MQDKTDPLAVINEIEAALDRSTSGKFASEDVIDELQELGREYRQYVENHGFTTITKPEPVDEPEAKPVYGEDIPGLAKPPAPEAPDHDAMVAACIDGEEIFQSTPPRGAGNHGQSIIPKDTLRIILHAAKAQVFGERSLPYAWPDFKVDEVARLVTEAMQTSVSKTGGPTGQVASMARAMLDGYADRVPDANLETLRDVAAAAIEAVTETSEMKHMSLKEIARALGSTFYAAIEGDYADRLARVAVDDWQARQEQAESEPVDTMACVVPGPSPLARFEMPASMAPVADMIRRHLIKERNGESLLTRGKAMLDAAEAAGNIETPLHSLQYLESWLVSREAEGDVERMAEAIWYEHGRQNVGQIREMLPMIAGVLRDRIELSRMQPPF